MARSVDQIRHVVSYLDRGGQMARKVDGRQFIEDLRCGMKEVEMRQKYGLSRTDFKRALEQIARERRRRAEAIAKDLKEGRPASELMIRFQLSDKGFREIVRILGCEGFISPAQQESLDSGGEESLVYQGRRSQRYSPMLSIRACDKRDRNVQFSVKDISEEGLSVIGLRVMVHDMLPIVVMGDEFGDVSPFELEAQCRWSRQDRPNAQPEAGFQVTNISDEDRLRLRELIERVSLPLGGSR